MLLSRWWYYLSSIPTLLRNVKNWPRMVAAFLGVPGAAPFVVCLKSGYRFHVRSRMDVWIIKEICLEYQYERASVDIQDGWTVLDIGAGLGDFSVHVAGHHPHCNIFAYEPFPQSFALLQENLKLNNIHTVRTFSTAVSASAGSTCFHIATEAVAHSTVETGASPGATIQVPSITLEQVLAQPELAQVDYLKMDCEGAEYEMLFTTPPEALRRIRHLCLEYHDGLCQFSHQDLARFLAGRGYAVKLTPSPAWAHLGLLHARRSDA